MASSAQPFRPYEKLVQIQIEGKSYLVPENNTLLRALQFLAPEDISYGRFCWNQECQTCLVVYALSEGTHSQTANACRLVVQEGMRVLELSPELRYCLRNLKSTTEGT